MSLSNEELIEQEMIAVAIMEYQKYMDREDTLGSRLHKFQDFVNKKSLKDTKVAPGIFGEISSFFSKSKGASNPSPDVPPILNSGSIPSPVPLDHSSHGIQHGTPLDSPSGTPLDSPSGTPLGSPSGTPLGTPRGSRPSNVEHSSLSNIKLPMHLVLLY